MGLTGAGGIGCELLKNLLLSGFGEIHIIDLDTIDLSNLNRQFLFRYEHIKKSKALVAKEAAHKFQPKAKLNAYHANIKDSQFNVDWFATFDIVFNALDNLDARRHVNRMCLAADVPLIESGTTGFNGQVQVIKKAGFIVVTIDYRLRSSTPSQPIHCIVWAKSYLFPELFGIGEDETPELDHSEDAENAEEIANLRKEAQALKEIRQSMGSPDFARRVFEKVFIYDIDRLRGMEDMWKVRDPPTPLDFGKLQEESADIQSAVSVEDQRVWSLTEDLVVFKDRPVLDFDKDDVDTLDFVTASANLRASIFGIDPKSKFDTKQMAGNIIPAIATTNAMTAGLCVLQAMKVLNGDYDSAKMVFLERSGVRAINSDSLKPPNPNCPVCSVAHGRLKFDPECATVGNLVEDILRLKLGYGEEFSISTDLGVVYDPDLEDNLPKKLSDLGVKDESFIIIVDEEDDEPRVNLELIAVTKKCESSPDEQRPVSLDKVPQIPLKPKAPAPTTDEHTNGTLGLNKRKRDAEEAGLSNGNDRAKRMASVSVADGDGARPIVLDEAQGGAILIDDD
ncbi:hypothetical protein EYZ11_001867 [Aspergillus tanneri]|uniref:Ubiquitin-activating enzyme E1-like n=1 Tax=Aspergillus tanneri TaxID=1220188 RepID=A0A4V3UQG5_9EURO|nr:hypothetical protein EYZ11_001867 [Aspergillus tanneri]